MTVAQENVAQYPHSGAAALPAVSSEMEKPQVRTTGPALPSKPITARELAAIHAQWAKIDAGRCDERDSRTVRLEFVSRVCMRPVASTKDLTSDEALKVISAMRQETGEEFKPVGYRGKRRRRRTTPYSPPRSRRGAAGGVVSAEELTRIGQMAVELFGERWNELLAARCAERFQISSLQSLSPRHARALVEELLQRLAVRNIADRHQPPIGRAEIEVEKAELRKKFFGKL